MPLIAYFSRKTARYIDISSVYYYIVNCCICKEYDCKRRYTACSSAAISEENIPLRMGSRSIFRSVPFCLS